MNSCPCSQLVSGGGHTRLPGSNCEPAFDTRQIEQGPRLGRTAPVRSPTRHRHQGLSRWCLRGLAYRWSGACSGQPLGDLPRGASPECRDHQVGVGVQQRGTATTATGPARHRLSGASGVSRAGSSEGRVPRRTLARAGGASGRRLPISTARRPVAEISRGAPRAASLPRRFSGLFVGVRGRCRQVSSWPSTRPDRRLGHGLDTGPPPDRVRDAAALQSWTPRRRPRGTDPNCPH
ncbi:hypothetical protein GA0115255_123097 [Streptomyces sp. Ncost-T6T-2b]|nr:hypothetical protein GA0115255_123097 [Streptomyces sp. Ncost-T6T-2b]